MDYKTKTSLILPFKGIWLVGNGGRDPQKNNHFYKDGSGPASQKFAYDFARSHKGEGKALDDYKAFGAEVIAPADGKIVQVIDGSVDVPIGESDGFISPGNMIVIDHENGEWSVLAHLKYNSIQVKVGDRINKADLLGLCGNTGRTTEPHIHYHLQNGPFMNKAVGLPAQFSTLKVDGILKEKYEPEYGQNIENV